MKKIIVSQNFNGWCPVITDIKYSDKIILFSEYIRNKYPNLAEVAVICLQEFIAGKNGKYLEELKKAFPAYDILTPPGFHIPEHPRSLLTISLVRKEYRHELIRLESCLPNRICYLKVWLDDTPLRILNMYAVQTAKFPSGAAASYIAKRKEQKEDFWSVIISEAEVCTEPLLLCGDMQEGSHKGSHIKKLTEFGFREKNGGFFPTVKNDYFEERSIDHFLYNPAAWEKYYPLCLEYDGNLLDVLSDHVLLAAVSA